MTAPVFITPWLRYRAFDTPWLRAHGAWESDRIHLPHGREIAAIGLCHSGVEELFNVRKKRGRKIRFVVRPAYTGARRDETTEQVVRILGCSDDDHVTLVRAEKPRSWYMADGGGLVYWLQGEIRRRSNCGYSVVGTDWLVSCEMTDDDVK